MATTPYTTAPGVTTLDTLAYRNIWWDANTAQYAGGNMQLDGTNARDVFNTSDTSTLEAGLLMGKITTGGLYRNCLLGVTTAGATNGATALTVTAACATEVARLRTIAGGDVNVVLVGPPTAAGTVAVLAAVACSAATGTTLTVASIGAALATGSLVCPADGSYLPKTFVADEYGVPLTLNSGSATNQFFSRYPTAGDVNTAMILGYSSMDASVKTWVKTQLNTVGTFRFDDNR